MLIQEARRLLQQLEDVGEGKRLKNQQGLATELGLTIYALKSRLKQARSLVDLEESGNVEQKKESPFEAFEVPFIPSDELPVDELLEKMATSFEKKKAHKIYKDETKIKINIDGAVGFNVFGDIHIDSPHADIPTLLKHIKVVQDNKPHVRGIMIGDHLDNWVGFLARNYAYSETTTHQAWQLVQWLVSEEGCNPICAISGNHGAWSGSGDPVKWMLKPKNILEDDWGIKVNFQFPNGREFKMYNKHNFKGSSIYNKLHGVLRAAMLGQGRGCHLYIAGHLHTGSIMQTPLDESGETVWVCRAKGYKWWDSYAHERLNFEFDAHAQGFESIFVVVDPDAKSEQSFVTCFSDPEEGVEFLNYKRSKFVG
jgi:hypothetical protein